jgi:spore coat polysaccharide biosynthesis protein SpsF
MSSTRLPGKSLVDIAGRPMIWHLFNRISKSKTVDEIILATSNLRSDDPLARYVRKLGYRVFRYQGDINDVVGRILAAAKWAKADIIAGICGDCPLIAPKFIDDVVRGVIASKADSARLKKGHECQHEGLDVCTIDALRSQYYSATKPYHKEHLNIYLKENQERFKWLEVNLRPPFNKHLLRLSVDTPSDLQFMREVYARFAGSDGYVNFEKAMPGILADEKLLSINGAVKQKSILDKSKKIAIRTAASESYGLGHLRRMMSVARILTDEFFCGVIFVINKNEIAENLLIKAGLQFKCLADDERLLAGAAEKADLVIIDLPYEISVGAVKSDNKKIVVIDRLGEMARQADLVILPNVHSIIDPAQKNVISGEEYVIVNESISQSTWQPGDYILICFGGADPHDLTDKIISRLAANSNRQKFGIYLGPYNVRRAQIIEQVAGSKLNAFVFPAEHDYFDALAKARGAILGFGVSAYEAAHLGMPVLAVAHKDERVNTEQLKSAGIFFFDNIENIDLNLLNAWPGVNQQIAPVRRNSNGARNVAKKIINLFGI